MTDLHHYKACGLDNVWLVNGFEVRNTTYGETVSYFDIDGLHSVIGKTIAKDTSPLSPKEFRFLRREMDLTQKSVAAIFEVAELTVGRWERGTTNIPGAAAAALRMLYLGFCDHGEIKDAVDRLAQLDKALETPEARIFAVHADNWRFDEAA
ncbi:MAG: transcriptional regulator [Pseudomonadota bacterium]